MKDYSAMSDFEINKLVMSELDINPYRTLPLPNYCSNPADAWPIITRNEISIIFNWNECGLHAALSELPGVYLETRDNPLRTAMIVFLMMKEGNADAE
ncbi:phage protein NinX family protein [Yersinia proxima]|uniref:phage protein NinX family protein n=1 Tax=Yersinia proxima TaxID=2890316 RepID=UPI003D6908EA